MQPIQTGAPLRPSLQGRKSEPVEVRSEERSEPLQSFKLLGFSLLTLLVMLYEFGGALESYFTSDDLIHITYAHRIFTNSCELLFRTFSTVWMQDSSTEVFYRPLIEVSFAVDQLFSGACPLGYHISNFLYSLAGALALLSISRSLAKRFDIDCVAPIGYAAALLFAINPLHTEVTTWLIGRVDGLSTMFYLFAFALFLKLPSDKNAAMHRLGWLSLLTFFLALLCKEMAASLPFVVFACSIFSAKEGSGKWRRALVVAAPYLSVLGVYFMVRFLATGAFLGGYVGAVGEANIFNWQGLVDRLIHMWKIAFPFNEEVIERDGFYEAAFRAVYVLFGIYLVARSRFDRFSANQLNLMGFLTFWLVLQCLPLYQVFMLHNSLAGSRLFYLSTAVISILAVVALMPGTLPRGGRVGKRLLNAVAAVIFCGLATLFVIVGRANNQS